MRFTCFCFLVDGQNGTLLVYVKQRLVKPVEVSDGLLIHLLVLEQLLTCLVIFYYYVFHVIVSYQVLRDLLAEYENFVSLRDVGLNLRVAVNIRVLVVVGPGQPV